MFVLLYIDYYWTLQQFQTIGENLNYSTATFFLDMSNWYVLKVFFLYIYERHLVNLTLTKLMTCNIALIFVNQWPWKWFTWVVWFQLQESTNGRWMLFRFYGFKTPFYEVFKRFNCWKRRESNTKHSVSLCLNLTTTIAIRHNPYSSFQFQTIVAIAEWWRIRLAWYLSSERDRR